MCVCVCRPPEEGSGRVERAAQAGCYTMVFAVLALSTLATRLPPLPPECSAVTYAIHKPRGVLSAARDANPHRRTLTDVMVAAGVEPLPGHVGRLDLETSGLILVTADGLLLEAALGIPRPGVTDSEVASASLTKTYELLLAGRHAPDSPVLRDLGEPLTHQRGGREFHSDAAVGVRHLRSYQCAHSNPSPHRGLHPGPRPRPHSSPHSHLHPSQLSP